MPADRVQIRLDLSTEERQRLRIIAAHHDISMAEFARKAVKAAIEQEEQEQKRLVTAKILRSKRNGSSES